MTRVFWIAFCQQSVSIKLYAFGAVAWHVKSAGHDDQERQSFMLTRAVIRRLTRNCAAFSHRFSFLGEFVLDMPCGCAGVVFMVDIGIIKKRIFPGLCCI
jgi:hypothetical protein